MGDGFLLTIFGSFFLLPPLLLIKSILAPHISEEIKCRLCPDGGLRGLAAFLGIKDPWNKGAIGAKDVEVSSA
jgi:hypothetical protein